MSERAYTPDEMRQINLRLDIAGNVKHRREQDFIKAVYAQALGEVSYVDGHRVKFAAFNKMIEARKEYDAAMTAYQELINHD